jgi:hypothetical protein
MVDVYLVYYHTVERFDMSYYTSVLRWTGRAATIALDRLGHFSRSGADPARRSGVGLSAAIAKCGEIRSEMGLRCPGDLNRGSI